MKEFFASISVRQKLWLLVAVAVLATGGTFYQLLSTLKQHLLADRQVEVKNLVDVVYGTLEHYAELAGAGQLSEAQAKQGALSSIKKLRYGDNNYFWINDMNPTMLMHPLKPELNGKDLSASKDPTGKHLFMEMVETVKREGSGFVAYQWSKQGATTSVPKISYVKGFTPWGWIVGSGIYLDDVQAVYQDTIMKEGVVLSVVLGLMVLITIFTIRGIMKPLRSAASSTNAVASGDFTQDIAEVKSRDEIGDLSRTLRTMQARFTEVMRTIKTGASEVNKAADQIAQGNTNLSQRTEEQAASLEETASSMEQMTATVKQNADNAREADKLASDARAQAEKGGQVVSEAVAAMGEINVSSKQIADIIGVIDEIAFQTNLLALNAAVEAARAGEQGRGFAVVASEVRNLAQRSAKAAKEIKELIKDSVSKVEDGSRLVDKSGQTLEEIILRVKQVSDIVAEIAAASVEQSSGIEQVNTTIMQMDKVTQQNAVLVQEATVASGAMDEQTHRMQEMMAFFKVGGQVTARAEESRRTYRAKLNMDFGETRAKHMAWKSRLRRFLDGEDSMSQEQAVSHKHCDLGKWLYSQGLKQYGDLSEMRELEQVHRTLHGVIKRIVELKHAGKSAEAEREFEQVEPISQQIVALLNSVEHRVKEHADQGSAKAPTPPVERRSVNRPWTKRQTKVPPTETPKPAQRRAATGSDDDGVWKEF